MRDALSWKAPEAASTAPPVARSTQDIIGWAGPEPASGPHNKSGRRVLKYEPTDAFNPILGSYQDPSRESKAIESAIDAAAAVVLRKQRALPPCVTSADGARIDIITAARKDTEPSSGELAQQKRLHAAALRYRQDPLIVLKNKEAEEADARRIARIQRSWIEQRDRRFNIITGADAPPAATATTAASLLAPTAFDRISKDL